ncbi:MAG TPA: hypothetical protein VHW00_05945 [Thermoanaerobaculia bacterium]|nr:hypothetical protein [Thermoanaerobaculia bacterium]
MGVRLRVLAVLILVVAVGIAPPLVAKCVPKHTLRIVMRYDGPDVPKDHFIRQPKTLYRSGETLGRMEEEANRETGIRLLVVVNGADLWMVNLMTNTGEHAIDPDPTPAFRAPIIGDMKSDYWNNFEFGCEVPFMESAGATKTKIDGGTLYEHTHDGATARLTVSERGLPKHVSVTKGDTEFSFVYDAYEQIVEPNPTLFAKPAGVRFTEAPVQQ